MSEHFPADWLGRSRRVQHHESVGTTTSFGKNAAHSQLTLLPPSTIRIKGKQTFLA